MMMTVVIELIFGPENIIQRKVIQGDNTLTGTKELQNVERFQVSTKVVYTYYSLPLVAFDRVSKATNVSNRNHSWKETLATFTM